MAKEANKVFEELQTWIEREKAKGLEDVKFFIPAYFFSIDSDATTESLAEEFMAGVRAFDQNLCKPIGDDE